MIPERPTAYNPYLGSDEKSGNKNHPHFDSVHGVEKDYEKAIYYYELAAKAGHEESRYELGCLMLQHSNESNRFTRS